MCIKGHCLSNISSTTQRAYSLIPPTSPNPELKSPMKTNESILRRSRRRHSSPFVIEISNRMKARGNPSGLPKFSSSQDSHDTSRRPSFERSQSVRVPSSSYASNRFMEEVIEESALDIEESGNLNASNPKRDLSPNPSPRPKVTPAPQSNPKTKLRNRSASLQADWRMGPLFRQPAPILRHRETEVKFDQDKTTVESNACSSSPIKVRLLNLHKNKKQNLSVSKSTSTKHSLNRRYISLSPKHDIPSLLTKWMLFDFLFS